MCAIQYTLLGGELMSKTNDVMDSLLQELRRGVIVLGVLSQLHTPQYGYSLVNTLEEKGLKVDPGSLYPLLRRLEGQGLLESTWDTNEARPRKYYNLSPLGREVYTELCGEWQAMILTMNKIVIFEGESQDGFDQ